MAKTRIRIRLNFTKSDMAPPFPRFYRPRRQSPLLLGQNHENESSSRPAPGSPRGGSGLVQIQAMAVGWHGRLSRARRRAGAGPGPGGLRRRPRERLPGLLVPESCKSHEHVAGARWNEVDFFYRK